MFCVVICILLLFICCKGSVTSVGEERANLSAVVYLLLCGFCLERFPLPLGAWDGLYFLLWHSLSLPYNYFEFVLKHYVSVPVEVLQKPR